MCLQETLLAGAPLPGLLSMPIEAARGLIEVAESNSESYQPSDHPSLGPQRKCCSSCGKVCEFVNECVCHVHRHLYVCMRACMYGGVSVSVSEFINV